MSPFWSESFANACVACCPNSNRPAAAPVSLSPGLSIFEGAAGRTFGAVLRFTRGKPPRESAWRACRSVPRVCSAVVHHDRLPLSLVSARSAGDVHVLLHDCAVPTVSINQREIQTSYRVVCDARCNEVVVPQRYQAEGPRDRLDFEVLPRCPYRAANTHVRSMRNGPRLCVPPHKAA